MLFKVKLFLLLFFMYLPRYLGSCMFLIQVYTTEAFGRSMVLNQHPRQHRLTQVDIDKHLLKTAELIPPIFADEALDHDFLGLPRHARLVYQPHRRQLLILSQEVILVLEHLYQLHHVCQLGLNFAPPRGPQLDSEHLVDECSKLERHVSL